MNNRIDKKSSTFSEFISIRTPEGDSLEARELERNASEGKARGRSLSHIPTAKQEWEKKEYQKSLTHNHYYPPVLIIHYNQA
jgi:hypothetical protein